ncbi:TPA: nucleoside hydrolase [Legionella pneumophila subsp. pneumophila]|uniref:nucleoside hydrolase n=1 Tax=Legionella pneumophila TaxID=446 RepID=UPI001A1DFC52|nr:nucleoside hydrolase [Legionella pneumophila subsp. pneumophila]HAU0126121.1 nucleoside hydrolase [Legionella pneumophila]HAT9031366.1 nucleoside hydrolase [Legionella pneumophila subsp. pneumophila]HAU0845596.1 nucleoside hydrolase [Legionella pneumophila]HAU0949952.1 nucleoside hydrolase [Legionella pneumophila]
MKILKFLCSIVFSLILITKTLNAADINYIIDTDIGGDIDDVLALFVALDNPVKPLAITTTHIEPREKAQIAKFVVTYAGFSEIPVYAGIGTTRNDPRELFLQQNPLWPPFFGYPDSLPGESPWFPQQAVPYRQMNHSIFDEMNIEEESAPEYLARIAKNYSPQHKLVIVSLGPLHNISAALKINPSISSNLKIYSMGGIYPKGYNWLVSPEVTAQVLGSTEVISIVSQFVDAHDFYITPEEFLEIEKSAQSEFGLAVIQDWKNWYKIDKRNLNKTHLSDPVTLYLALHPEEITHMSSKLLTFPCLDLNGVLAPEFAGSWYNMPGLENKLMKVEDSEESHIKFVSQVESSSAIRRKIINSIKQILGNS